MLQRDPSADAGRTTFASLLRTCRLRVGCSQNELARRAGIDPAYVNRMEASSAQGAVVPRRRVVEAMATALDLDDTEMDQLLVAAGYCPRSVLAVGSWDPALGLVAEVLSSSELSSDEKRDFREVVRLVATRWRRAPVPGA